MLITIGNNSREVVSKMKIRMVLPSHGSIIDVSVLSLMVLLWTSGIDGDVIVKDSNRTNTIAAYPDMQAGFGPDFPVNGLEGLLMYASPDPEACSPVDPPPEHGSKQKWILLIARGVKCEFADKVLNAQRHGYRAAIVHNYPDINDVIPMGGGANGSRVKIPSTFVGGQSGMDLLHYVSNASQQSYFIRILETEIIDFGKYLWPFILVMVLCILVAMMVLLVKFLRDRASQRLNRLSRKHLKKIPVRKFKKGDYYDTCAICLDEYEEGEKIRVLPCDHVYHMKCIDPWLTKNKKTCPVCKRRVIPADAESGSDTEDGQAEAAGAGSSETRPLLGGESRQSHGSMSESAPVIDAETNRHIQFGRDGCVVSVEDVASFNTEHGAVGGEGISNLSHQNHITETQAMLGKDNAQDTQTERDSKRRSRSQLAESGEEASSSLLAPKGGSERRGRKKHKKSKSKKSENRERQQDHERASQEPAAQSSQVVENVNRGASFSSGTACEEEMDNTRARVKEVGGQVNQGYSNSEEVIVPAIPHKCEMNEVV